MARVVNEKFLADKRQVTPEQLQEARRLLRKAAEENPLRRVKLACCETVQRDPIAQKGDRVWCDSCNDWGTVMKVEA